MKEKFKSSRVPKSRSKKRLLRLGGFGASALLHYGISVLPLFCAFALSLTACAPQKEKVYRKSMVLMDTVITISVVSDSEAKAEGAIDKAFSEIGKLNGLLNFFSPESELSLINKNAGEQAVRVNPATYEAFEKAVYASRKTDGAFDVTIGPVITLWDFHNRIKPEDKKIKERLPLVNYKDIVLYKNASSVYLNKKGMLADLGGMAKGYAADKAVEILKKNRINSALVSVAGDIRAFGLKPDGKPWKVGIKNPRSTNEDNEIMTAIELKDMAISTSGDYERYFIIDGKRYHHILNPKTGFPAGECRSVSVIAKEGSITDPFSTGIFVLGPEKGIKLLEEMGLDGIIVDKDGKILITSGLRGKIEIKRTD